MPGPTNHTNVWHGGNPGSSGPVTSDQLLDHAQGRLSPAELAEISRLMAEDPALQMQYAEIRRLRRLVRESYQPPAVARPDARDEEVAGMIAEFVDAIRSGVMPEPDAAMLAAFTSEPAAVDEWDESTSAAGHVISGPWSAQPEPARISTVPVSSGQSGRQWRRLGGYAAAAVLLLGLVVWSVAADTPLVERNGSGTLADGPDDVLPVLPPIEAPEQIQFPGMPTNDRDRVQTPTPQDPQPIPVPDGPDGDGDGDGEAVTNPPDATPQPEPGNPGGANGANGGQPDSAVENGNGSPVDEPRPDGVQVGYDPAMVADMLNSGPVTALTGSTVDESGRPRYLVSRPRLPGDIDGNGVVDRADGAQLKRHVLDGTTDQISLSIGDLTRDGKIDVSDWNALWAATGR